MKKAFSTLLVLIVMMTASVCVAQEEDVSPYRADPVFGWSVVYLDSGKTVEFEAQAYVQVNSIRVSSVTLQKNQSGSWVYVSALPVPTTVAYGSYYAAMKTYSFSASGTYRVRVVFNADGHLYTTYSNEMTY